MTTAVLALTACSGDAEPDGPASSSPASETAAATDGTASASVDDAPPALDRPRPALRALTISTCESGEGEVAASGRVRNNDGQPVDFVVTVEWLDERGTVLATEHAVVEDVRPRRASAWEVTTDLAEASDACTTRAASGRLPA